MVYFVDCVQVFQSQNLCTSLNTIVIPENTQQKSIQTSQYTAKFSKFYLAVSYCHPPDPIVHSCGDPSSSEERARSLLGWFLNSELSKSKAFFIAFFSRSCSNHCKNMDDDGSPQDLLENQGLQASSKVEWMFLRACLGQTFHQMRRSDAHLHCGKECE